MMKVERENWRVYMPRVVTTPLRAVAYLLIWTGFELVDLVDPRVP